jgi:hypothetical protein
MGVDLSFLFLDGVRLTAAQSFDFDGDVQPTGKVGGR